MTQDVFDNDQLSAMRRAINQIMHEIGAHGPTRNQVAKVVLMVAAELGEFDAPTLVKLSRETLDRSLLSKRALIFGCRSGPPEPPRLAPRELP